MLLTKFILSNFQYFAVPLQGVSQLHFQCQQTNCGPKSPNYNFPCQQITRILLRTSVTQESLSFYLYNTSHKVPFIMYIAGGGGGAEDVLKGQIFFSRLGPKSYRIFRQPLFLTKRKNGKLRPPNQVLTRKVKYRQYGEMVFK